MGGRGSGRPAGYAGKPTTEDSLPLDIRRLQRSGVLAPGRACSWQWTVNDRVYASIQMRADAWQVELSYTYTAHQRPAEVIRQAVMLETTPCTLGGRRSWFRCPTCARRVAVIYGAGRLFACRICKGLPFACQREADDDRAARRADRIRKKLGWMPGILNEPGLKPKGMHWRTFRRLVSEHDAWVDAALAGIGKRLGLMNGMLADFRARTPPA